MLRNIAFILLVTAVFGGVFLVSFDNGHGQAAVELPERPNIVVIMSDDQDIDSLPVMRHLLSYIGGGWIRFTNAFANDAKCCPSRTTFLTGQYSHHHGVITNGKGHQLDDAYTLPVWLSSAGYHTGLIGKYLIGFPWTLPNSYKPPGWDVFQDNHNSVDDQTAQALAFLDEAPADSPFFLYLAYTAPHHEAIPPERYADVDVYMPPRRPNFNEADVSDKPLWVRREPPLSPMVIAQWDKERANGQRELLAIDDGVLAVMDKLTALGQLNNTIVIYLGDQGFSWGSHRWLYKNCPYVECSNYPLFIRVPGGDNRLETRLVSNADLAPTLIELAGASIIGLEPDGRSFAPLLADPAAPWTEGLLLERHAGDDATKFYAIQTARYMYGEYLNGDVELYDMLADPYQLQNVVDDPAYAAARAEMQAWLQRLLNDQPLPTVTPVGTPPTATPTAMPPTATPSGTPPPTATGTPSVLPTDWQYLPAVARP
ncbi:MAG: sulfatase-like hydrolase/transferase [Candidatus Promineofilum sp.]|nr:sulfatase-like hydrolase/transferase [Promineifilum sp.]